MKKAILVAASVAVVLGLTGCACHQNGSSQTSANNASAQDNSGYQSGYSSKLGKKSH